MGGYDVVGNIAIVKFSRGDSVAKKKKFASKLLKEHSSISTVLEKTEKFKGRLRTLKTEFIAGVNTKEALYRENGCVFRFNVDTCYFSPRLSQERMDVARSVKKGEDVAVLFGGVAPFAIVIAKMASPKRVVSVELGKDCSKYALENVKRNKVDDKVKIVQGDVRRVLPKMRDNAQKFGIFGASKTRSFKGFDRVVMARPNLTDSFLDVALPMVKKGGIVNYYGFCPEEELEGMQDMLLEQVKKARKKVKILGVRKAGDIGVRKYRYRIDMKVLN